MNHIPRRVMHFTLGIGKPWHWFATWMVVDLMPLWSDLRERLPPTPGGLRHGDCAGHAARRAILFPAPFALMALLAHRLVFRCVLEAPRPFDHVLPR